MEPVDPANRRSRAGAGIGAELRATLALAAPLAAANLAQMAMGVTDIVMVGRLGAVPLAAAGLGAMLYFTGGVMLQGILSAVAPLAAHALGAGDRAATGPIAGAGLVLALMLALPFVAVLTSLDRLLHLLGYDAALAAEIGRFLRAIAWGGPAFLGFAVLRSLLAALSHTRAVMAVLLACVAGNAGLNWMLIYGHLGAPALGVAGSGYASAINQWLIFAGLGLCTRVMPGLAGLHVVRSALAARCWATIASILRVGLPIGGIMGVEVGVFLAAGVLIGLLGAAALGAHQLVLNCAGISFMVPLALSQAATVRVAYELGAGRCCGPCPRPSSRSISTPPTRPIVRPYGSRTVCSRSPRYFRSSMGCRLSPRVRCAATRTPWFRCCSPASAIGAPGLSAAGCSPSRSVTARSASGGALPSVSRSSPFC